MKVLYNVLVNRSCLCRRHFRLLWISLAYLLITITPGIPLSNLQASAQTPSTQTLQAEASQFFDQGIKQFQNSQFHAALQSWQQVLTLVRQTNDQLLEARTLGNLGLVQAALGEYEQAIELQQQALMLSREIDNSQIQANTLGNLGNIYLATGQYPQAIDSYQEQLKMALALHDYQGQVSALGSLGVILNVLGQYSQAIEFQEEALALAKEIGDRQKEANLLGSLGYVYFNLEQYQQAIELQQQRLSIARELSDREGESRALNNLGEVYRRLEQYQQAIEAYNQSLQITREIGNRSGEAIALGNLGLSFAALEQFQEAMSFHLQALAVKREIGDRAGEAVTLSEMAQVWESQNQPELAITFYKQSVNVTETIRNDLHVLPQDLQQSYTDTIADTYRALANLLLKQGRILEAQQVLELLKVEELREYTEERSILTTDGIQLTETEQRIVQDHDSLVAFGQRVEECQQTQCSELNQLLDQRDLLTKEFIQTIHIFETEVRSRLAQDRAVLDTQDFSRAAREIVDAQPGTVLIYPFVLEDKLWLLWATSGGVVNSVEVPVTQQQLGGAVLQFRQLLDDPTSDLVQVQATAQQLYDWLVAPLQSELEPDQIQHLVFSLDRVTRYIPIAALFDGEQYLIERYTVSTILSADLTNVGDRLSPGTENNPILALGLSEAVPPDFNALTHVPDELDAIVREDASDPHGIYPGLQFLNDEFDRPALRNNLYGHRILHIATHAVFQPGLQDQSYLLLGTGAPFKIADIQTLQDLGDLQLVILSACETALGAPDQDGIEIPGIAFNFLNGGADTVIASLWSVADVSTANLMQQFYQRLGAATTAVPITRAEALRQAQLSLLHGEDRTEADPSQRGIVELRVSPEGSVPAAESDHPSFSHPYYWAPFILIGNGL